MENLALNLFGDVYAGRRVLVTGHTGFKGSWLVLWLRQLGATVTGLALDPDTHPSHWSLLGFDDVADHRVDLRNATAVCHLLDTQQPEIVFHLAAQPLVRRSYRTPAETFASNVTGLVNLLDAIRDCPSVRVLINATTDKVYAERDAPGGYLETDPLGGHDPYSASKACAELVTDSYRKSFFSAPDASPRIASARAGNVIGGGDWAEDRLVPDIVRAANTGHSLRIRNPSAVRPWQHVLEPLSGYLRLAQMLWHDRAFAGAWNFGPRAEGEISVSALAEQLSASWPALRIEHDAGEHPHEAAALRLNCDKACTQLSWQPVWNIATALARTADWYRQFHASGQVQSAEDLAAYIDDARRLELAWAG